MVVHFSILPTDILQTLAIQLLDSSTTKGPGGISYLNLPHPRTGILSLFLLTDAKVLEVQAVSPPDQRSWFIEQEVISDGKLLIMTPIDPAFLLLPLLLSVKQKEVYRTEDDILEEAIKNLHHVYSEMMLEDQYSQESSLAKSIRHFASLSCTRQAFRNLCDFKDLSIESQVYRYSSSKVVSYMQSKVARLAAPQIVDECRTMLRGLAKDGLMEDGKEGLLKLGRMRSSCNLVSHYLPLDVRNLLLSSYDFTELDQHLNSQVQSIPLTASHSKEAKSKGVANVAEKKRKAGLKSSHGVEKLKRANVNGMAKLSSFFNKAEKDC